jgi:TatD DNase family protein
MNLRLIDAHCHVNFGAYKHDAEEVIRRSLDKGVGLVNVGSQKDTSARAVEMAEKHDGVWAAIGLHPIHLHEMEVDEDEESFCSRAEKFDADLYRQMARNPKVVAIGECGLDYYHVPPKMSADDLAEGQKKLFRQHIELSLELGLPLMLHCRDAHADMIAVLKEYAGAGKLVRGDVHCFTGTWAEAEQYLNLGLYISFTGIITYKPRAADLAAGKEILTDVVRNVPLDRLIVETDAPYLAPVPHRGERNEPAYVEFVAKKVAEVKRLTFEEVAETTLRNTKALFGI